MSTATCVACVCPSPADREQHNVGLILRSKHAEVTAAMQSLYDAVNDLRSNPDSENSSRLGVLFGTHQTLETKTATHVLWILFNILPAKTTQKPHRHTPTALDYCISAPKTGKLQKRCGCR